MFRTKDTAEIMKMSGKEIDEELKRLLANLIELKGTLSGDINAASGKKTMLALAMSNQITRWINEEKKDGVPVGEIPKIMGINNNLEKVKALITLNFDINNIAFKNYHDALYQSQPSSPQIEKLTQQLEKLKPELSTLLADIDDSPNPSEILISQAEDLKNNINDWLVRLDDMKNSLKTLPADARKTTTATRNSAALDTVKDIAKEISAAVASSSLIKDPNSESKNMPNILANLQKVADTSKEAADAIKIRKVKKSHRSAKKAASAPAVNAEGAADTIKIKKAQSAPGVSEKGIFGGTVKSRTKRHKDKNPVVTPQIKL